MSVGCPQSVAIFSPFPTSHNRIAIFSIPFSHQVPDARYLPHGENAKAYGFCLCGCSISKSVVRVSAHQRRSSPNSPPAISLPHGENTISISVRGLPKGSIAISSPDSTSHSRAILSLEPLTSRLPSGEKHTDQMCSVCPISGFNRSLRMKSHR